MLMKPGPGVPLPPLRPALLRAAHQDGQQAGEDGGEVDEQIQRRAHVVLAPSLRPLNDNLPQATGSARRARAGFQAARGALRLRACVSTMT